MHIMTMLLIRIILSLGHVGFGGTKPSSCSQGCLTFVRDCLVPWVVSSSQGINSVLMGFRSQLCQKGISVTIEWCSAQHLLRTYRRKSDTIRRTALPTCSLVDCLYVGLSVSVSLSLSLFSNIAFGELNTASSKGLLCTLILMIVLNTPPCSCHLACPTFTLTADFC